MPNANTYNTSVGYGSGGGSAGNGIGQVGTAGVNYGYTMSFSPMDLEPAVVVQSDSPDLPAMVIVTSDETGREVRMTLAPESNIASTDLVKLFMLVTAMTLNPTKFNALAHVKKYNLERHFKYA